MIILSFLQLTKVLFATCVDLSRNIEMHDQACIFTYLYLSSILLSLRVYLIDLLAKHLLSFTACSLLLSRLTALIFSLLLLYLAGLKALTVLLNDLILE